MRRLSDLYREITRRSGRIGGAAAGGPLYGELTAQSMDRVVETLRLAASSILLDLGSGIGKPGLHATFTVGCRCVGVEVNGLRWWRSLTILRPPCPVSRATPPLLLHADGLRLPTLEPCTHVYTFNPGWPVSDVQRLCDLVVASTSVVVLACFQHLFRGVRADRQQRAPFNGAFRLVTQIAVTMSGSGQRHTCYVYRRVSSSSSSSSSRWTDALVRAWSSADLIPTEDPTPVPHGTSYAEGLRRWLQSAEAYAAWVADQIDVDRRKSQKRKRVPTDFYHNHVTRLGHFSATTSPTYNKSSTARKKKMSTPVPVANPPPFARRKTPLHDTTSAQTNCPSKTLQDLQIEKKMSTNHTWKHNMSMETLRSLAAFYTEATDENENKTILHVQVPTRQQATGLGWPTHESLEGLLIVTGSWDEDEICTEVPTIVERLYFVVLPKCQLCGLMNEPCSGCDAPQCNNHTVCSCCLHNCSNCPDRYTYCADCVYVHMDGDTATCKCCAEADEQAHLAALRDGELISYFTMC